MVFTGSKIFVHPCLSPVNLNFKTLLNGDLNGKQKTAIAGGLVGARGLEPPNLINVNDAL
jgi:hypothetical protein